MNYKFTKSFRKQPAKHRQSFIQSRQFRFAGSNGLEYINDSHPVKQLYDYSYIKV